jgi:hypothetical protein
MRPVALGLMTVLFALSVGGGGGAKSSSYASVEALRADAIRGGLVCPTWTRDDRRDGTQAGSCSATTRLFVYKNGDALNAAMDQLHDISGRTGLPFTVLVGENWVVNDVDAAMLQKELGGEIVTD